jgi:hypothetical protein
MYIESKLVSSLIVLVPHSAVGHSLQISTIATSYQPIPYFAIQVVAILYILNYLLLCYFYLLTHP